MATSVIILSDKSSGSSLLQRLLVSSPRASQVRHTPHHENETLFWMKAAAALSLPQVQIMGSRAVPMSQVAGETALRSLLSHNAPGQLDGAMNESWVMSAWDRLATAHGPVFVEKSPHHLHSASALELIERCAARPGADVRLVGLVRDPVDTLYSMWCRWSTDPARRQSEWVRAYRNLQDMRGRLGARLCLVRYEDLVRDRSELRRVSEFCGLEPPAVTEGLHADSVGASRRDHRFAFRPEPGLVELAAELGYIDVAPSRSVPLAWPAWRGLRFAKRAVRSVRQATGSRTPAGRPPTFTGDPAQRLR